LIKVFYPVAVLKFLNENLKHIVCDKAWPVVLVYGLRQKLFCFLLDRCWHNRRCKERYTIFRYIAEVSEIIVQPEKVRIGGVRREAMARLLVF
jgi:hypothetical protein